MILPETIDKGIEILRSKKDLDSAVTVSDYNMFSPIRARKIGKDGCLQPFIPFDQFKFKIDSNRQKQDSVYFHDCGASIVRPHCIENVHQGLLPQKWMGKKIYPLTQTGGLAIEYSYEIPIAEYGTIHLKSDSGLNEKFYTSNVEKLKFLKSSLKLMKSK